jgi:gliding motility-associated-like protein
MKNNKANILFALFFAFIFIQIAKVNAQMVGPDAYIQGTSVEIGVSGLGGFEGTNQTTSPPPAGYHARGTALPFGFIANPQLNSWLGSNYDGDFFTPGSPENGWGFEIGTTGVSGSNNCTGLFDIPGAFTNWSHVFDCYNATWEGDFTSTTDLHFKISYDLIQTDLFYTTTVSITNNTAAVIPDMYYYRNVDPDNNEEIAGAAGFTTSQTIVSQPASGCNLAHVSATSPIPWTSYLGFAASGANWRADFGGFGNRDASDLWTGTGFTQTVGATNTSDEAISLAYRIQNLAPGATETFKFVVILDAASATAAVNNLLYLSYPGSATAPPSACTPFQDTIRTCGAPVPIAVTGPIVGDYTWTWTPTTGLTPITGPSVVADPLVTTTYTAIGTPIGGACSSATPITIDFVVQVTPSMGPNPVITPVPVVCETDAPFNLTVDSTGGTWLGTGITSATLGTFSPLVAGPGTHLITYFTSAWCNNIDTINITVLNAASATITQPAAVCSGTAPFNLTAAATGGIWTGTGITSPSIGTFDPIVSGVGSFIITYTISGLCPSVDTVVVTVNPQRDATITQPPTICVSAAAFNLTAVDAGGVWSGVGITNVATGLFNPTTAGVGTHIITYTIGAPCGDVDTVIVTVLSIFNPTITNVSPVCITAAAFNMQAVSAGGVWTGAGITNATTGTFDPGTAGAGVHIITYTISGLCGAVDTALVTVIASPVLSFVADTVKGCEPTTINFVGTTDQPGGTYFWNFGVTTTLADTAVVGSPAYTYTTAGVYTITMTYTNSIGCSSTITSNNLIVIYPLPVPDFVSTPLSVNELEPTVHFFDQSITNVTAWSWSFGTGDGSSLQNPTYIYAAAGTYPVTLIVTTIYGCVDTITQPVIINPVYLFYAPNAFTPDGSGYNDVFIIKGENIDPNNFEMTIFDRWGERIFRTNSLYTGWNGAKNNVGALVEQGVYVWKIDLRDGQGARHQYIGHVTIVK